MDAMTCPNRARRGLVVSVSELGVAHRHSDVGVAYHPREDDRLVTFMLDEGRMTEVHPCHRSSIDGRMGTSRDGREHWDDKVFPDYHSSSSSTVGNQNLL